MNIRKIESWKFILASVFFILVGIFSYLVKTEEMLGFFKVLGILVMLGGAFQILVYFFRKDYNNPQDFSFSFGILIIMAGLWVELRPLVIINNYPQVLAVCVLLTAILRLQHSMNLLRLNDGKWKILLVCAAVPAFLAGLIILVEMQDIIKQMLSFTLILEGVLGLYGWFVMKNSHKNKLEADSEKEENTEIVNS